MPLPDSMLGIGFIFLCHRPLSDMTQKPLVFIFIIFLLLSGCAPAVVRLYAGAPPSKEQVSLIGNGSGILPPLKGFGRFSPMKVDGSEKCLFSQCEVLPGKHSLEVTYNWWTEANHNERGLI